MGDSNSRVFLHFPTFSISAATKCHPLRPSALSPQQLPTHGRVFLLDASRVAFRRAQISPNLLHSAIYSALFSLYPVVTLLLDKKETPGAGVLCQQLTARRGNYRGYLRGCGAAEKKHRGCGVLKVVPQQRSGGELVVCFLILLMLLSLYMLLPRAIGRELLLVAS